MNSRASRRAPTRSSRADARTQRRQSKAKRRLKIGLVVAGILVLGSVTWLATRVLVVKTDLEASQTLVDQLQAQIASGDFTAVSDTSAELEARSNSAAAGTRDLTWRAAEVIPFVGSNLSAVRAVAESIDDIVEQVAVPAVGILSTFDIGARDPETGGFDLSPIDKAESIVTAAETVFPASLERLSKVDTGAAVGPVSAAVTKLDGLLTKANDAVVGMAPFLKLAGPALGRDGARNYLLAFQNNAESTALGGSAASFTMLSVDGGAIAIAGQAGSADFPPNEPIDATVDQSAINIYSDYLVSHLNTSTSRPDFPTAARIMQAYWQRDQGTPLNGVISVDPLALAQILKATGPVTLPSGDVLSSDNAVQLLVNEIYFRYDSYLEPEKVDGFFQSAAAAILAKVTSGEFDINAMMAAMTTSVNQGSIMMWSADEAEQALLDGTRIQGALPKSNDDSTVIGTYFRDTSASKIDYYLQTNSTTTSDVCSAPANPTFSTTVTLHSNLSLDQAKALPEYIRGYNFGASMFRTQVFVYGPVGATLAESRVDASGVKTSAGPGATDLDRPVAVFEVDLAPGETSTVTATFTGAPGTYGPLEIRGTPMINPTVVAADPSAPCG